MRGREREREGEGGGERGRGRQTDRRGRERRERDINNNWHARMVQTTRQPVAIATEEQLSTFLTSWFNPRYLSTIRLISYPSQGHIVCIVYV